VGPALDRAEDLVEVPAGPPDPNGLDLVKIHGLRARPHVRPRLRPQVHPRNPALALRYLFGPLQLPSLSGIGPMLRREAPRSLPDDSPSSPPQLAGFAISPPLELGPRLVRLDSGGDLHRVLSRDELLDNLMLYWLPGTGAAARLYWESLRQVNEWISGSAGDPVTVPTGCSVFPKELQRPSRRWAERRFPNIRYWNEPAKGGHFAAFEQPELFVEEVRSFFRLVR
jgi:pimeloyl-ACP methyl ester carboxylesterase